MTLEVGRWRVVFKDCEHDGFAVACLLLLRDPVWTDLRGFDRCVMIGLGQTRVEAYGDAVDKLRDQVAEFDSIAWSCVEVE